MARAAARLPDGTRISDHVTATQHRTARAQAFAIWAEVTGVAVAA